MTRRILVLGVLTAILGFAPPARQDANSASHLWRFNEVFSNEDGTIQFIEMKECCGATAEHELQSKWILAVQADHQYTFRSSLTGNTANKHLLLATQAFADLPGAPTPDFIIPDGFVPLDGDTFEYWLYGDATWACPAMPLDGYQSMSAAGTPGMDTPTNYAGESATIDLRVPVQRITWGRLKSGRP